MQSWDYLKVPLNGEGKVTKIPDERYVYLNGKHGDAVLKLLGLLGWELVLETDTYFRLKQPIKETEGENDDRNDDS